MNTSANYFVLFSLLLLIVLLLKSKKNPTSKEATVSSEPSASSAPNVIQDNPKLTHCAVCNGVMAKMVPKCPHCGHRNAANATKVICAMLVLFVGLPVSCAIGISSLEPIPITNETDLSRYAHLQCEKAAKSLLKAPASAKSGDDFQWSKAPDKQAYTIKFAIDAQNGFGAMLRNTWFCKIEYVSGNEIDATSWKVTDLVHN